MDCLVAPKTIFEGRGIGDMANTDHVVLAPRASIPELWTSLEAVGPFIALPQRTMVETRSRSCKDPSLQRVSMASSN